MSKINNSHIAIDTKDTMVWIPAESKTFTVQSCYKVLLPRSEEAFPASAVWSTLVPMKVAFTVWAAYFRKLPTVDALKRRGRICPNRCELCYNEEETCDHILLHYKFSWEIWTFVAQSFNIQWCPPQHFGQILDIWSKLKLPKKGAAFLLEQKYGVGEKL
ncbi:Reverse transcriptase zinc-binding domain [Macleaya cordata]|uniref:Reverse transcriptase zinc-binding domain n=1 Tax=Macleaya cordata TaxID=56857 RepID=A0A200PY96_MACCD|nr:Reverse transcriptase zinc-binding domain [Macleaya cordata]